MPTKISKSRFKAQALQLFRQVERTGQPIVITDRGTPVLKVVPYRDEDAEAARRVLRESVLKYESPTEPVAEEDWESAR
ncbi:MAG: type II toxin-antitoxin system Phd/YefM family antitoxin [Gemmatimonadales bacterium]